MSAIDPITAAVPSRGQDEDTFNTNVEQYLAQLKTFSTQLNANIAAIVDAPNQAAAASASATTATTQAGIATAAAAAAASMGLGTATSVTPNTIAGSGTKNWTIQTSKAWVGGMWAVAVQTSNAANWMLGQIPSSGYNSGTGALQLTISASSGSGSGITDWTFYLASPPTTSISGALTATQQVVFSGVISPASIGGTQNDYNPAGWSTATIARLTSSATYQITGLAGGVDGRVAVLMNVGANSLLLMSENAGSTAANRFTMTADSLLLPGQAALLMYDGTGARWRLISMSSVVSTKTDIWAPASYNMFISPKSLADSAAFQTLGYSSTVTWNTGTQGFNTVVTLGGNGTIDAPSNLQDGLTYCLKLVQDGTGSRVPTWHTIWDWGDAGTPTLQTGVGKVDYVFAIYDAARNKLVANFRKGV